VAQVDPVPRGAQRAVADSDVEALEVIPRLDQALVDLDRQAELGRDRLGGLDSSLERRAAHYRDVAARPEACGVLGHQSAVLGQAEARDWAVKNAIRVRALAVPHEVNDCRGRLAGRRAGLAVLSHGSPSLPAALLRQGRLVVARRSG